MGDLIGLVRRRIRSTIDSGLHYIVQTLSLVTLALSMNEAATWRHPSAVPYRIFEHTVINSTLRINIAENTSGLLFVSYRKCGLCIYLNCSGWPKDIRNFDDLNILINFFF